MAGCNTGRNIQKYKGSGASTLQDVTDNSNTTTGDIITTAGFFIGDGSKLTNIPGVSDAAFSLQQTTNNGNVTTDTVEFRNGVTSLTTSGNVLVTGNVTASAFYGDGGLLSNTATNPSLQTVTTAGKVTTDTVEFQNSVTSLTASSNVSVTGNVTASKFYGDGKTLTGVALSADLASNSTRIGTVSTDLTSNASRIGVVETDLASNSTRIGIVSTDLASNSTRIGIVSTDLASNSTRIGTVSTDLASNSTRIGTVSTDLVSNSTRIGTVSTDLASNSTRIGTVSTDLVSNSTRIGTVSTDLASNASRIGVVETDLASNSTRIGTVSTDLTSNASRIGVVETDLASNSTRIGTVSTDLTSNSSRIGTVSTDLTSNASRINTLEGETQPANRGGTGQTSYTVGQLLVASDTAVLSKLTPGTSGHFLKSQGAGNSLIWASVADIGSATPGELIMGSYLTGGPHTGEDDTTITADATTTNTASKLVARDGSGDIFVQNLYTDGGIGLGHASDTTLARDSAGVATIAGAEIRTGTVPIGKGGTGQTTASAAASALGVGTEDSPQFTAIELGHASDTTLARDSAGVVTIEGAEIRTGTVPIGKGGTGQTTASAAASALGVGTEDSPQFTAIELGHATDTTLARDSAGVVTIEGAVVRTGTVARGDGGTGQISYSTGDILYGASSGATLNKLSPAGSNADVGKFLKLGSGDEPVWASVSTTGVVTSDVTIEDTDHALTFVSSDTTDAQTLKKEWGTLKYKPSSGTLTTSNVITSDTSIHARNGIANTTPTHTLDIGSNVSVIDDGIDKLFIRGNCYVINDIISLGTVHADTLQAKDAFIKRTTVVAERPTRQVRLN